MILLKPFQFIAHYAIGLWIIVSDFVESFFVDYSKIPSNPNFPNIYIKNFGQMDNRFYRGAQPLDLSVYIQLQKLGVNTVISLRYDNTPDEQEFVALLGMQYVHIPIPGGQPPTEAQAWTFLDLLAKKSTGVVFVHCHGGRHRTGAMGAVYRFSQYNWTFDQAYKEMKDYGFYSSWGFGDIKQFVQDYYNTYYAQR